MAKYAELVLSGHGEWKVKATPAYAEVPRGTEINFYTENFKLLMAPDITNEEIALRLIQQFRDASPNQTGTEFRTVPNYILQADDTAGAPEWVYTVSSDTPLCTDDGTKRCGSGIHRCDGLFSKDDVVGAKLYWAACRWVSLNEVDDADYYALTGLNARQPAYGEQGATVDYALANDQVELYVNELDAMTTEERSTRLDAMRTELGDERFAMVVGRIRDQNPSWEAELPNP